MDKTSDQYSSLLIYLVLALTTLVVFWQVPNYDFVNYDDMAYVAKNPYVRAGLKSESITWAFTKRYHRNWLPLTWLSFMLDSQLFGINASAHHVTNLLLHITNTLLLFGLLKQMTAAPWRSAFVAAAFALHPLHVESVAWISERKDVLSTLFWLLTIATYLCYLKRTSTSWYLLTLLTFALGLMAKPMLVTLPFVLLLLDYWPLRRFQLGHVAAGADGQVTQPVNACSRSRIPYRLIGEKIPFFALSAVFSIVTFLVHQSSGAMVKTSSLSLNFRISNALFSYVRYIGKTLWPRRLAVFYPLGDTAPIWQAAISAMLLIAISICVVRLARSRRYLPVGWFWYLGTLVPVIGLIQDGEQALADRYTYMPLTGLFIIISWGLPDLLTKWRHRRIVLGVSMPIILLALAICTSLQLRHWRNSITLFQHALHVTEDNYVAHFSLAKPLYEQKKYDQSIVHSSEVLHLRPNHTLAYYGHALTLIKLGRDKEAIDNCKKAVQLRPDFVGARYKLAVLLCKHGKTDEAIAECRMILQINPNHDGARRELQALLMEDHTLQ